MIVTGTLTGVEMGLKSLGVPHRAGGVTAAMDYLSSTPALAAA
jgi:alanine-glyoxylate transaminase/serine-glyoxylate transaminase/serine-pyruvate transaminase